MKKRIFAYLKVWTTSSQFCIAVIATLILMALAPIAQAMDVFNSDFSKGTFETSGWKVKGDWSIVNFGDGKPDLAKNPGPVAKFPAKGNTTGTLTKAFGPIKTPGNLKLTFDAGYGWGARDHSQGLQVMILDPDGNGYSFVIQRAKATWGVQWGGVSQYGYNDNPHWNPTEIDATQPAVIDGGGLRTFTITRDAAGKWTFNSDEWTGGPVTFTDNTTTTFSQVVLCGTPNIDDLLFGKIKLESDKAPDTTLPAINELPAQTADYLDFNPGRVTLGSEWIQNIVVKSPALRSDVKGNVKVEFTAPGMTKAAALCWQQPTKEEPNPWGHDAKIADITLDAAGNGSFIFPAEKFPNGPVTVRVLASNDSKKDSREIQLYNTGGVVWNQGIPKTPPPAAKGMKLVFSDDFNGPLSISKDGKNAKYSAHKPGGGDFSGWQFADPEGTENPFSQQGTFLRIRGSKRPDNQSSSGLISSVKADGTGFYARAPFYMECRFTAQSAPGTWPAFWTLIQDEKLGGTPDTKDVNEELDIIEAYGGVGPGNPNHPGYSVTSHFWNQKTADGKKVEDKWKRIDMLGIGGKSYWSTTFHTYALKVTPTDTIYYMDDIEVFRHPSGELSKTKPTFFMINYAIGGISGWKIDLEREGNTTDMYVDYVRVYESENK